jgi:hypothetical protein
MSTQYNRFLKLLTIPLFAVLTLSAQAALLLDGGFEEPGLSPWTFTSNAQVTSISPISGSQSALLSNNGLTQGAFVVGFQTILLNDSDYAVGDEIFLSGLTQLLSVQGPLDRVYIELALRNNADPEASGSVGDVDFLNSVSADALFDTPLVQTLTTSSLVITEFVTSLNGETATTQGIRIAIAIAVNNGNQLTAALFDDIKLQKVSAPGFFSLLIIAMLFTALRKRTAG